MPSVDQAPASLPAMSAQDVMDRNIALRKLAEDLNATSSCVGDQFAKLHYHELLEAGIGPDGVDDDMWHEVLSDGTSPIFDPLMLAISNCTDEFAQLAHEEMSELLAPNEIECVLEFAKSDSSVVAVLILGTRDGVTAEEAYPPETMAIFRRGFETWERVVETMRARGQCPEDLDSALF